MKESVACACGKVILVGEHAVVHGSAAIAAAIREGVHANARATERCSIEFAGRRSSANRDLELALEALVRELGSPPVAVQLHVQLPIGCGLGASAAMGVAAARAVANTLGPAGSAMSEQRILAAALAWERVFHGNPSGVDTATAAQQGCLLFRRGERPHPLTVASTLWLGVAVAGPPAATREMVARVARLSERDPAGFSDTLQHIDAIVEAARHALQTGDAEELGQLMEENQRLLCRWDVSTEDIERVCRFAVEAGALGAKLTGAGGGGCVIALAEDDISLRRVLEHWTSHGVTCFAAPIVPPGATS